LATLAASTVEPYDILLWGIKVAQASDPPATDVKPRIVGTPMVRDSDLSKTRQPGGPTDDDEDCDKQEKVISGALTYEGRIYVAADPLLRNKVISRFDDNPESVHLGALRTAELGSRDFNWPAQDATIRKFITGCEV
jgi:hypothetical protein